jgi:hypothetical protein
MHIKSFAVTVFAAAVAAGAGVLPARAQNEPPPQAPAAVRFLWNYVNPSVIFLTTKSGQEALGDAMFYRRGNLARKPLNLGKAYGVATLELINITNKFIPYISDSNFVNLYGGAFRIAPRIDKPVIPYAMVGAYYGSIESSKVDVKDQGFVPSGAIGVAANLGKGFYLEAQYRFNGDLGGVNFNGISLDLRIY